MAVYTDFVGIKLGTDKQRRRCIGMKSYRINSVDDGVGIEL